MTLAASPVSFKVHVTRLPQKGLPVEIDATPEQRAALVAEHGLQSLDRFHATMLVEKWKAGGVQVTGRVEATLEQICVVTLDPVPAFVAEDFVQQYVPPRSRIAPARGVGDAEIMLDPNGPDAPELLEGEWLDVGQLAEEFFALALDPYPRKGSVSLPLDDSEESEPSPFAKLALLRGKS